MTPAPPSLLTRRHRSLVLVIVGFALLAQWIGVAMWIAGGGLHLRDGGPVLIGLSLLISVAIVLLGAGLYVVLGHVRSSEQELARMATTDVLTGILNRRGFMSAAAQEFTRTTRYDRPLSVLVIDIDHFKLVNDAHGHAVGDVVLQALTVAWQSVLRTTDTVGRIGGEEFAVLLPETNESQARELAERLRQACARLRPDGLPEGTAVTVSIGVGYVQMGDSSIEHAMARADEALYRAKGGGRNQVRGPELERTR